MADWARPACGLYSWTLGCTDIADIMSRTIRFTCSAGEWFDSGGGREGYDLQ